MRQDSLPRASRMTGKPLFMRATGGGPPKRPPASAHYPGLSGSLEKGIPVSGISSSTITRRTVISQEGWAEGSPLRSSEPPCAARLATAQTSYRARTCPTFTARMPYPAARTSPRSFAPFGQV